MANPPVRAPLWRRLVRRMLVIRPALAPIGAASALRWSLAWPSWRPRAGWWVVECPPCASGLAAVLMIEEGDAVTALTVASRGVSKRMIRFTGAGRLQLRVIPSVPGMRAEPRPLFSQATGGFVRSRMLAKLGRLAARGMVPRRTMTALATAPTEEVWRIYDISLSRGLTGRVDPITIAEEMSLRTDALEALAGDAEARLAAVRAAG